VLVGFAAETQLVLENARKKLATKNLDMICANDVARTDAGFDVDTNKLTLLTRDDVRELPLMTKREAADALLSRVLEMI
jgi:phosphopantothenoylcysteine decarboxylase/phosphopantothenate--cysteine ligase